MTKQLELEWTPEDKARMDYEAAVLDIMAIHDRLNDCEDNYTRLKARIAILACEDCAERLLSSAP